MYQLPDLPYSASALQPHIDERTMQIHHDLHHATYVEKLNAAVSEAGLQQTDLVTLLRDLGQVPQAQRQAVRNHGGGHLNHSLLWRQLSSEEGVMSAQFHEAIDEAFGSTVNMLARLQDTGAAVFGSGWAWLASDDAGKLSVMTTANQDNPLMSGLLPVLGIDVWEHAYYLCYQNRRPAYLEAFVQIIDWAFVSERYERLLDEGPASLLDEL